MDKETDNNNHFFKNKSNLPICLQQAKFIVPDRYMYGVPIQALKTNEHRVVTYFKPISKLF